MTAVWLDSFNWLTKDSKHWRALLDEFPTSGRNKDIENLVTKMVHFEANWDNGHPQHIRYFRAVPGFVAALVPGGRWFLYSIGCDQAILSYCDLDSCAPQIPSRVLTEHSERRREIWAMDLAVDGRAASLEFDLAIELAAEGKNGFSGEIIPYSNTSDFTGQFYIESPKPRKIMIWRVRVNDGDELDAELVCSFNVFRRSHHSSPISLWGDFLLRASYGPCGVPVYTVHRWRGLGDHHVSHSLLLPAAEEIVSTLPICQPTYSEQWQLARTGR